MGRSEDIKAQVEELMQKLDERANRAEANKLAARKTDCDNCEEAFARSFLAEAKLAWAEAKFAAAHRVMEAFADALDSGPSTHLLATELRNRWRAALAAARDQPEDRR